MAVALLAVSCRAHLGVAEKSASDAACPASPPLRLAVVQVHYLDRIKKLRQISSDPRPADNAVERRLVGAKLFEAEADSRRYFLDLLGLMPEFQVQDDVETKGWAAAYDLARRDETISPDDLSGFARETNADAVLRFRISDYGRTPTKYVNWIAAGTHDLEGGPDAIELAKSAENVCRRPEEEKGSAAVGCF